MTRDLVADATCLLNLRATGRSVELLDGLELTLLVPPQVIAEPLYLSSGDPAERFQREKVDLSELLDAGRLRVESITREELDVLVRCAELLHDADAAALTLAVGRQLPLATDDGRQREIARKLFPEIELLTTSELLARAVELLGLDDDEVRAMATSIALRANYLPPRDDPHRAWFLPLAPASEPAG